MSKFSLKIFYILVFIGLNVQIGQAADDTAVDCENATTQFDMSKCAHLAYQAADKILNVDYKAAKAAMIEFDGYFEPNDNGAEQALLSAQRAWIKFRDLACISESFLVRGGTMQPMVYSTCLERLTLERSKELRDLTELN